MEGGAARILLHMTLIGRYTHVMCSQHLEAGRIINAEFTEYIKKTASMHIEF